MVWRRSGIRALRAKGKTENNRKRKTPARIWSAKFGIKVLFTVMQASSVFYIQDRWEVGVIQFVALTIMRIGAMI